MFGFVSLSKYNKVLEAKFVAEQNLRFLRRVFEREIDGVKDKNNLTREELMFVIKCIHPDKHSNSSISNRVTGQLLDWK